MENIHLNNITTDQISLPLFTAKRVEVDVLRLDRIHPVISGNKWFKLRYYLDDAIKQNKKNILTFGGAWSNHIIATAAVCRTYGLQSIGFIRGEEPTKLSSTLKQSMELGMKLIFLSREDYKEKKIPAGLVTDDSYMINEGGYGAKGMEGAATIAEYFKKNNYTHICCACGTGTMTAGLAMACKTSRVIAISVLKNNFSLEENIRSLSSISAPNFSVIHDYHFGGYAKHNAVLLDFMNEFFRQTSMPTDFVYTGKLFFGIHDLLQKNYFPAGSKLLLIHSGGLQGNDSLSKGTLIF